MARSQLSKDRLANVERSEEDRHHQLDPVTMSSGDIGQGDDTPHAGSHQNTLPNWWHTHKIQVKTSTEDGEDCLHGKSPMKVKLLGKRWWYNTVGAHICRSGSTTLIPQLVNSQPI